MRDFVQVNKGNNFITITATNRGSGYVGEVDECWHDMPLIVCLNPDWITEVQVIEDVEKMMDEEDKNSEEHKGRPYSVYIELYNGRLYCISPVNAMESNKILYALENPNIDPIQFPDDGHTMGRQGDVERWIKGLKEND